MLSYVRFSRMSLAILALVAPLEAQTTTLSYGTMSPNGDGRIDYRLYAKVPIWRLKPLPVHIDEEPQYQTVLVNLQSTFRNSTYYWYTPQGVFPDRTLTREQMLGKGITSYQLDALEDLSDEPIDRSAYPITYHEYSYPMGGAGGNPYAQVVDDGDRRSGSLSVDVVFPDTPGRRWVVLAKSGMGEERFGVLENMLGQQTVQINGIEAGNCLFTLFALGTDGSVSSFYREVPILVRKDAAGVAQVRFLDQTDPGRFKLASLALGQTSQSSVANLPLQQGKAAMVRVMAMDAFGSRGAQQPSAYPIDLRLLDANGNLVWTQRFSSNISGKLVKSGRTSSNGLSVGVPGPEVPAQYIQPGIRLEASLLDPSNYAVLNTLSITPEVAASRHIVLHGYDVRPPGGSGCPVARDVNQMNAWIMPYVREAFPYSTVEYRYEGKIWVVPVLGQGAAFQATAMVLMNDIQGFHQTDPNAATEHLYVAMINTRHAGSSTTGMAWYGYRGIALARIDGDPHPGPFDEALAYNLVHEMGHCFGLEHAPSRNASSYSGGLHLNRVDGAFQYGGGGMAGGWGYSSLGKYFLAEDNHLAENGLRAHWDVMSYTYGFKNHTSARFSDLSASRLRPGLPWPTATPVGGISTIPYLRNHPAISVLTFGPDAAAYAEYRSSEILGERTGGTGAETLPDRDPSLGDPDDPTPPVLVVTKVPQIPGLTDSQ